MLLTLVGVLNFQPLGAGCGIQLDVRADQGDRREIAGAAGIGRVQGSRELGAQSSRRRFRGEACDVHLRTLVISEGIQSNELILGNLRHEGTRGAPKRLK